MINTPEIERPLRGMVQSARELEGGPSVLAYWCKGATVPQWFVDEIQAEYGETYGVELVRHQLARCVPAGPTLPGQSILIDAREPGRGVFWITILDVP